MEITTGIFTEVMRLGALVLSLTAGTEGLEAGIQRADVVVAHTGVTVLILIAPRGANRAAEGEPSTLN
ncbi:hypothetical protein ACFC1I_07105 [Microbacterium sp. NPDC056044]|uniref:hypothetical protein n=1 Tax=Microbacterium sp. NPDC056044 TaxID=3345690 RepID=UPI0035D5C808